MGFSSVEHGLGDPLWSVVLGSSRESDSYREVFSALLSSDREQKLLYTLSDSSAIERMLNVLDLESRVISSKLKTKREQRKAFVILKRMCRAHAKLPSSYVIEGGIEREGSHAWALGGAADVWRGRYYGKLVAIKSLRICRPQGETEDGVGNGDKKVDKDMRRLMQKFCHEAVIWKRLSHPNLLPFLGVNRTLFRLAMVSAWMEHGTILQFVKQNVATNRLKLLHDVASGLEYLHRQPFVHSDIKSANILIDSNLSARIGDFGLTYVTSSASISMALSTPPSGGTCRWMAPELLKSDDAGGASPKPSKESDVYAFGMVAYEIFAHCPPFRHLNSDYLVILDVIAGKRPARPPHREVLGLEDSVWDIVQGCWDPDPQTRPTIKGLRGFLGQASRRWTPPTSETIAGFDFDSSAEVNIDSTTGNSTTSEGFLGTPAGLRTYTTNTTVSSDDDRYVDFTSYSDGTDPYHPHSGTDRSVGNPSGTPSSSSEEESLRNALLQERELASLRTREWVQAQRFGFPPETSPRRPGVTFEESPIIHIVPQPSSETLTDETDKIQVDAVPPPPPETRGDEPGKIPTVQVVPPPPPEARTALSDDQFEILTRPAHHPPSDTNRYHQPTDADNHHHSNPAGGGMYAPRIDPIPLPPTCSSIHRLIPSNIASRSGVQSSNMALPPPPIIFAT